MSSVAPVADNKVASLFQPLELGSIRLQNRIVMAPLTRGRAGIERVPNDLMLEYYTQRVSAGLIITEAAQISEQAVGWIDTPGIHTLEQVKGWRKITDAVHKQGGKIFLQLWHTGRASHPDFLPNGATPVSASAVKQSGEAHVPTGKKPYVTPHPLDIKEIPLMVQQYVNATKRAQDAGFDGVEIHAANGYLIDQFLRDCTNKRTDAYGGSIENRARFMLEVTEAVVGVWSSDKVGIRLSPTNPFNDMSDRDPIAVFSYAAEALNQFNLAYLHVLEALPGHMLAKDIGESVAPYMRRAFKGIFMINGGYDALTGAAAINNSEADLVAYGVPFIANPDLPERFRRSANLNEADPSTFYSGGTKGYTDYPALTVNN
ncbi:MAG: alkene reductase [Calothrix sp. MO_167.B42]|nr:alkene reductase [Calothrix sp. MO_167.B42]